MTILNRDQALVQHICTANDTNGNPRRLWLVTTSEGTVALDEGYAGCQPYLDYLAKYAMKGAVVNMPKILSLFTIEVKPAEYKRLLKNHKVEDSNE